MKFISYQEKRNKENRLIRRYKVYNFLLFKIKKKVLPVFGENNKIIIGGKELTENDKKFLDKVGKITIEGNNNIVNLADICNLNCYIHIQGNSNKIYIGEFSVKSEKTIISVDARCNQNNREVRIEGGKYFLDCHLGLLGNDRKILIGNDCMFSDKLTIRTTDSHSIYDLETNKRINEEKDITIGDHVWIGRDVFVAKGSIIPSGCIIGAKSFVNKAFTKKNCIIAGIPAKVVKENIRWDNNIFNENLK